MTVREDDFGMLRESQGAFPPEALPNTEDDTVFSRRFRSEKQVWDISASPVIREEDQRRLLHEDFEVTAYDVEAIIETRDRQSHDCASTSARDVCYILVARDVSYERALFLAEAWVSGQRVRSMTCFLK